MYLVKFYGTPNYQANMYLVKFDGAPNYQANIYSEHGYPEESKAIDKFFRDLKRDIKVATVIDFCEKEDCFFYTENKMDNTSNKYEIPKKDLPEGIIEKLRELLALCKTKDKNKHPFIDYIKRFFINERQKEKEFHKEYLTNVSYFRVGLTVFYWIYVAIAAFVTLGDFSIGLLIEFLSFFVPTFVIRRTYRSITKTLKEIVKIAVNQKYYKPKKRISTVKKHKVINIRKITAKKKVNVLKNSIVEEIQIIKEIISKLSIDKQKEFQIELYNLLANYKKSLNNVRDQEKGLTLVYEKDIDNSFLSELVALETRINALIDENQDQYDAIMEEVANNLRESLGIENDSAVPMERTRNISKSI